MSTCARRRQAASCASLTLLTTLTASPSFAEGFLDDASAALNLRNYYINRNFVDPRNSQAKAEEWVQTFILDVKSGYTPGIVGFGVDLLGSVTYKLDGGGGTTNTGLLPRSTTSHNGSYDSPETVGRIGAALKAKVSKTEIKFGEQMPVLPILRADDFGRAKPQTFDGISLVSKELPNLTLYTGQMTATSQRNDSSMVEMTAYGAYSDKFDYAGGEYTFGPNHTLVGIWSGRLKDIYQQDYVGLTHFQPLGRWTLGAKLGYFKGKDSGQALGGALDNRTSSALLSARIAGHTLSLGLQQVDGATNWMRVGGTNGGALANDTWNNSFENAHERSRKLKYDYDFAAIGIPGLTASMSYTHGNNITATGTQDGTEWERDTEIGYTIQSGSLKSFNIRARQSSLRRDWNSTDFDEVRIIMSYP
ncbi:OprD family porin, partial [Pseudomonas sp.]|uniref:OprD family porin n=1 Tax=Pseudomonas sp. TaxID=306 RepID=UPI002584B6E5